MGPITTVLSSLPFDLKHQTLIIFFTTLALVIALRLFHTRRNRIYTPRLAGPSSKRFSFFGVSKTVLHASDDGTLFSEWGRKYGTVYEIPSGLGTKTLVLGDLKGLAHLFTHDTTTYTRIGTPSVQTILGETVLVVEGEAHKRQRRAMSYGLSVSAIRNLFPVFFESTEKLTGAWEALLESKSNGGSAGSITIDIQDWMNRVALDSIGMGCFSYDFESLTGSRPPVMKALDSFNSLRRTFFYMLWSIINPVFPRLAMMIHTEYSDALEFFAESLRELARKLLAREQGEASDKSGSPVQMSFEEMRGRVTVYVLGGYDTIAATLTWALIELSRNPDIQNALRNELQEHIPTLEGLTYDKLMNGLPYLDALVCEILRLHLSVDLKRQVNEDDTIPLSQPIVTASGALIDSLPVAKGTIIRMPIAALNRSEALWGPDATTFDPTRWLEKNRGEFHKRREEIPGYPHLLTFGYGPRVCIGKTFALAEIKAVLSVLVLGFQFEFPGGPDTKLGRCIGVRPKDDGEECAKLTLTIRKVLDS